MHFDHLKRREFITLLGGATGGMSRLTWLYSLVYSRKGGSGVSFLRSPTR
jgi:hypothetical protein